MFKLTFFLSEDKEDNLRKRYQALYSSLKSEDLKQQESLYWNIVLLPDGVICQFYADFEASNDEMKKLDNKFRESQFADHWEQKLADKLLQVNNQILKPISTQTPFDVVIAHLLYLKAIELFRKRVSKVDEVAIDSKEYNFNSIELNLLQKAASYGSWEALLLLMEHASNQNLSVYDALVSTTLQFAITHYKAAGHFLAMQWFESHNHSQACLEQQILIRSTRLSSVQELARTGISSKELDSVLSKPVCVSTAELVT